LVRLFGAQTATPKTDIIKDWAQDPLTATHLDTHAANIVVQQYLKSVKP